MYCLLNLCGKDWMSDRKIWEISKALIIMHIHLQQKQHYQKATNCLSIFMLKMASFRQNVSKSENIQILSKNPNSMIESEAESKEE